MGNRQIPGRLYMGIALLPILVGLVGLVTLLRAPHTGITFVQQEGRWVAGNLEGPAASLEWAKGKAIVAVAGFAIGRFDIAEDPDYIPTREDLAHWWAAQRHFAAAVQPGRPLVLTFRGGETIRPATVIPAPFPGRKLLVSNFTVMAVVALLTLFIGLVVVRKRPDDPRARVFFAFTVVVGFMDVTFGSYTSRNLAFDTGVFAAFRVINGVACAIFPAVFLHFCLIFPRTKAPARSRAFLLLLYGTPVCLAVLFHTRASYLSLNLFFLVSLFGGMAAMAHSYATLDSPLERAQVRWVIWGVSVFAAVFLATAYIPILFKGTRLAGDMVPTYFFPLIPLSIAFGITRYRLMDIETLFDNTLVYAITLGLLVLLDLGVVGAVGRLAGPGSSLSVIAALWIVVFAYIPIRERVRKAVRKLLNRNDYDPATETIRLSNALLGAATVEEVFAALARALERTLAPLCMDACLLGGSGRPVPVFSGRAAFPRMAEAAGAAARCRGPAHLYRFLPPEDLPAPYRGGLLTPLSATHGIEGVLVLGNKRSGTLYEARDLGLVELFADQAALAVENVRLRQRALEKEKELRREKERISMEIHDGVVAELAGIIAYSEKGEVLLARGAGGEAIGETLSLIGEFARRGLREIRNVIWAVRPDVSCQDFIGYLRRYCSDLLAAHGIRLRFTSTGCPDATRFSPDRKLILLRVVQEACQNMIAHAATSDAEIAFSCTDRQIGVVIADHGRGFDPGAPSPGSGLKNMRKRLAGAGGVLEIDSRAGKGTRLTVRLPL